MSPTSSRCRTSCSRLPAHPGWIMTSSRRLAPSRTRWRAQAARTLAVGDVRPPNQRIWTHSAKSPGASSGGASSPQMPSRRKLATPSTLGAESDRKAPDPLARCATSSSISSRADPLNQVTSACARRNHPGQLKEEDDRRPPMMSDRQRQEGRLAREILPLDSARTYPWPAAPPRPRRYLEAIQRTVRSRHRAADRRRPRPETRSSRGRTHESAAGPESGAAQSPDGSSGSWSRSSRIRRTSGLSARTMTGQPPGAKLIAIRSARTPAQSRNVIPARSRTSRSARSSMARAAWVRNPLTARPVRSTAHDESADRPVTDRLDRQIMNIHGLLNRSRGLDDPTEVVYCMQRISARHNRRYAAANVPGIPMALAGTRSS